METIFIAPDNRRVLTVKLRHETSLVAYSTDKHSKRLFTHHACDLGCCSYRIVVLEWMNGLSCALRVPGCLRRLGALDNIVIIVIIVNIVIPLGSL